MKFEKREYQEDIVKKVVQNNKHTLIHLPTGGGKTYIATEIIKELSSDIFTNFNQILFITPKIILMEQTLEAFDKGLRDLYSKKRWLKPKKIHASNNDIDSKVLVSTIHTASRRKILKPDIIIIDEIHYGFNGQMYKKLIENNPNARIIGLSATPYDQYGKKLKGFTYIDDYDIKYLMSNNFLVQKLRQYELIKQDLSKIRIIAGDYDKSQLSKFVCDNKKILEIVESTKDFIDNSKKTIVFAVDIEHSELLTQAYINAGFKAKALHSKLNKDNDNEPIEINEEIENFRIGKTKVLVSVLMLTTGFDVPDTDCAIIARPTRSQNLYKQMLGRILRKSDTKEEAILLDCGNVIENLGMPLDPIREVKDAQYNRIIKCKQCKSKNYKLTKINNILYWLCSNCGYSKKVDKGSYKCLNCHEIHSYDSKFTIEDNKLKLDCGCGYKTVISKYTNERLVEVSDNIQKNELERYVRVYIDLLIIEFGKNIINQKEIKKKIIDFKYTCEKNFSEYIKFNDIKIRKTILKQVKLDNKELYIKKEEKSDYLSFEEAREFTKKLGLKSRSQWKTEYCKGLLNNIISLPNNIPTQPHNVYKNKGWIDYKDWLGVQNQSFEPENKILLQNNKEKIKDVIYHYEEECMNLLQNTHNNLLIEKIKGAITKIKNKTLKGIDLKKYTDELYLQTKEDLEIIKKFTKENNGL